MTDDLTRAAHTLTEVLVRENAALEAFDVQAAGRLLEDKRSAAEALSAAHAAAPAGKPGDAIARLRDAARENQTLLERAISVQTRVIGIVARAAGSRDAPRYGSDGGPRAEPRACPMSLWARA